jgi:RNA polymerase sigma-70 factor (ECF subfamily)
VSKNEAIVLYRPLLQAIALKIVGSIHDAEDIVQDTFEKWLSIDTSKIQNTKAYLIRSVSNNSLKFINSLKEKYHTYLDHDDSLKIEDENQIKGIFHFEVEEQLSQAWAVLNKKLKPFERSVFVMREAFNLEYEELTHIFDKKVDNLRQIVNRARKKIGEESDKFKKDLPKASIPAGFRNACTYGTVLEAISELKEDVISRIK